MVVAGCWGSNMQELTTQEQELLAEVESVLKQLKPNWQYTRDVGNKSVVCGIYSASDGQDVVLDKPTYEQTQWQFDNTITKDFILDARNRYVPQLLEIINRLTR